jgi:hypothetical protein
MERLAVLINDPATTRRRGLAGLDVLLDQNVTDPDRVACIGYCFGATMALEIARSGADVKAVVTNAHENGSLDVPRVGRRGHPVGRNVYVAGGRSTHHDGLSRSRIVLSFGFNSGASTEVGSAEVRHRA